MLRADRELLARIARLNHVLVNAALPLADGSLTAEDQRALGDELLAVGQAFHDRTHLPLAMGMAKVIDAETVCSIDSPKRTEP